jgi:glycosyltransferase involved in cell wall biosynthesis
MMLGMPVVALATTEVPDAVPADAGIVTNDVEQLRDGVARLRADRSLAQQMGHAARTHALERFSLGRFLADWDRLLETTCR